MRKTNEKLYIFNRAYKQRNKKSGNLIKDYRFIFIGYYYYSAPQLSLAKRL